ncbi:MAG: hypothetical protein NTV31_09085 [Bacteroidia bacterium]|nr:hypothetical protein [Bacteroidia bacterium]
MSFLLLNFLDAREYQVTGIAVEKMFNKRFKPVRSGGNMPDYCNI